MKKLISVLAIAAVCISLLAGCGTAKPAEATAPTETTVETTVETTAETTVETTVETTAAPEMQKAEYTVYNTTGAKLTELYLYAVDASDKGENLAENGIADGESIVITREATAEEAGSITYILEFTAEGMDTQKFETLHFEVVSISLKSVDAAAGATPIAFAAP